MKQLLMVLNHHGIRGHSFLLFSSAALARFPTDPVVRFCFVRFVHLSKGRGHRGRPRRECLVPCAGRILGVWFRH